MDLVNFLREVAIVAAAGVVAAVLMAWIRLPAVAGFLLAGALVGPHAFALVEDPKTIGTLAEVGVVLLLFTIGLEFSLERFARIWNMVVIGGGLQIGLTTLVVMGICLALGFNVSQGVFVGFVLAQSSTSIVLQNLSRRREVDTPHGRFIVGAQIFQDLVMVPKMLVIPLLAGRGGDNFALDLGWALGKAALMVAAVVTLSRLVIPPIFRRVAAARSREAFLLAILVTCIGTAYMTSMAGLSLALGAFLSGLVIAGSPFGQRAMTDILPLRDLFASLFFLSLGMYFDIQAVLQHPIAVVLVFVGILFGKSLVAALAAMAMRFPARVAVIGGVGMAPFSEMGFVLATMPLAAGLVSPDVLKIIFAAGIPTMFITPLMMALAPSFSAGAALLRPLERILGTRGISQQAERDERISSHVIIAGYGLAGRLLAQSLKATGIRYLILELNAETVRSAREAREPAYYADVTSEEALSHAHIDKARALVLLINDADAVRRTISNAKRISPDLPVYVRAHYLSEQPRLNGAGAHDIVVEELEAGIELMARVLRDSGVPRNVITERVKDAREETQPSARKDTLPRRKLRNVAELDEMKIESFLVRDGSYASGRTLAAMQLRNRSGALVVAARRGGKLLEQVPAEDKFNAGDTVYLAGSKASVARAIALLQTGQAEDAEAAAGEASEPGHVSDPTPRSDMVHVLPEKPPTPPAS